MDEVLVVYAEKHGSTHEVAEAIAGWLAEAGVETHTLPADRVESLDEYRAVVLGGDAPAFLCRHRRALAEKPFAVFALGDAPDPGGLSPAAAARFSDAIVPETLHYPYEHVPAGDLRDWDEIEAWAKALPERLGLRAPALS